MSTSKQIAVGRLDPREPAGPRSAGGEAASRANSKLASRRSQIIPGKPNSAKTSFAPQSNQQNWVRSVILPHPGPHSPRARAGPNWVRSAIFPRPGPARPEPVPPAIGFVSSFCPTQDPTPPARAARDWVRFVLLPHSGPHSPGPRRPRPVGQASWPLASPSLRRPIVGSRLPAFSRLTRARMPVLQVCHHINKS